MEINRICTQNKSSFTTDYTQGHTRRHTHVHAQTHYLCLELFGKRARFFHHGHLTLHRGVVKHQAVHNVARGEDLLGALERQTHSSMGCRLNNNPNEGVCLCVVVVVVGHLLAERDDQLQAVLSDERGDVLFEPLLVFGQLQVCSALIKLTHTHKHTRKHATLKQYEYTVQINLQISLGLEILSLRCIENIMRIPSKTN